MTIPKITTKRFWSAMDVRALCIKNDLYTRGDNEAYSDMLAYVSTNNPTTEDLYMVAKNICDHSKGQSVSNIMFMLENDVVKTMS